MLFVFTFAYYTKDVFLGRRVLSLKSPLSFLIEVYTVEYVPAFWFIYSYIGMMLALPMLRKLAISMPESLWRYSFVLVFVLMGALPVFEHLLSAIIARFGFDGLDFSINSHIKENLPPTNVFYFMAGYYFGDVLKERDVTSAGFRWWALAELLALLVSCFMVHYGLLLTGSPEQALAFYGNVSCVWVFATFYCSRWFFQRYPVTGVAKEVILSIGSCTFGIMLLEDVLRKALDSVFISLEPVLHTLPACFAWILLVYVVGYLLTRCMKCVPGLKLLI